MLIRFSIDNYLSFRNKVTLDLEAGIIKEYAEDNLYSLRKDYKLLKCLAVYGINSSGKTNLLKAFGFMRNFILNSSKESQANEKIPVEPFKLNVANDERTSTFEVEFLNDQKKFRYGFTVTEEIVMQEWLFFSEKKKEDNLFIRNKSDFQITKHFKSEGKAKIGMLAELTRPNALFLSVLAQFNEQIASGIVNWFKCSLIVFDANQDDNINYTANLLTDPKYNVLIHQVLRHSDLGFTSVEQELLEAAKKMSQPERFILAINQEEAKNYGIKTKHKKYNKENKPTDIVYFDLRKNESLGTQRFFGLLGPIIFSLVEKRVIWIDELDSRLHTNLLHKIVKLFNSRKENPNGAQLIFTSHNPILLKKNLRRDQMIFVEKDDSEGSIVSSLYSKDPKIRNDASFDKDFLSGRYVDVPKIDVQLNLF